MVLSNAIYPCMQEWVVLKIYIAPSVDQRDSRTPSDNTAINQWK